LPAIQTRERSQRWNERQAGGVASIWMQRSDRQWALGVLGLNDAFTSEDLARAYTELKALWLPHENSTNPAVQAQGRAQIENIEKAHEVLAKEEATPVEEVVPESAIPLSPALLFTFIVLAFIIGFGGMFMYRQTHPKQVSVVVPKSVLTPMPRVRMDAPDVSVSSQPMVSTRSAAQLDDDRVNADLTKMVQGDSSQAIDDLDSMGARAVPGLTAALSAPDSDKRQNALNMLNALAQKGNDYSEDAPPLRPAFDAADTVHVVARLADDSDDDNRSTVASLLGYIGDPAGEETLSKLASDESPQVRASAAQGLGMINSTGGIPSLIALSADDDDTVRMNAVQSLASYRDDKRVHDALIDRLGKEPDDDIKTKIKEDLGLPTNLDERDM